MVHPQYYKNLADIRLSLALQSAKKGNIYHMEDLLNDADSILTKGPFKLSDDVFEGYLQKKEEIFTTGYTTAFEKNVELAKHHASKGNIKSMKKAINLAENYGSKIKKETSTKFKGLENKAHDVATNKMLENANNYYHKKNISRMYEALNIAEIYNKKTNNDLTGEIALLKNISKNNYSHHDILNTNYSTELGPLDIINKN